MPWRGATLSIGSQRTTPTPFRRLPGPRSFLPPGVLLRLGKRDPPLPADRLAPCLSRAVLIPAQSAPLAFLPIPSRTARPKRAKCPIGELLQRIFPSARCAPTGRTLREGALRAQTRNPQYEMDKIAFAQYGGLLACFREA